MSHIVKRLQQTLLVAIVFDTALLQAASVTVDQDEKSIVVETSRYRITLAADGAYTLNSATLLPQNKVMNFKQAGLELVEDQERDTWTKAYFGTPVRHQEKSAKAKCTVEQLDDRAICRIHWENEAAAVEKTFTFTADSPVVDIAYEIQVQRRLQEVVYALEIKDQQLYRSGLAYPAQERYIGRLPREAVFTPSPAYTLISGAGLGLGLTAFDSEDASVAGMFYPPGSNTIHLSAHSRPLRWDEPSYSLSLKTALLIGVESEEAADIFRKRTPQLPDIEIARLDVEKLIYRPDTKAHATVLLRNNRAATQNIVLTAQLTARLDETQDLPTQKIEISPHAEKEVTLEWDVDGNYGFELDVCLLDANSRVLDVAREYFAVSDHFVNVAQTTVWNAGWMRYDWLVPGKVRQAKENYVGCIEYYCWAPDQVLDLTPDTDTWEPHTESQGAYRTQLTKSFLKGLVDQAHDAGLRVLAMDTGFLSLPGALRHPERAKYTVDGQIYLYNGNIYDGDRFHAVGANVFNQEAIQAWAEEMCDSVRMFGWDGVRFDWSFIPCAPQDPLYVEETQKNHDAANKTWYTFDGRSAQDLFPDPDKAATEFCTLWRQITESAFPEFIFNANYSVNHGLFEKFPEYSKVSCRDAGILMESLLNTATHFPTWQEWSTVLTNSMRVVRPFRAQPFVGWMRGYAEGGIAHRNLHYIMMASGFRWFGYYGMRHSLDDTYKRFRHATRFSEYFYDPDFEPLGPDQEVLQVTGQGTERVLWKPFVFRRKATEKTEFLVHLLNLPENDYIMMHHEIPIARENLTVTLALDTGSQVKRCVMLVPDPEPRVEVLSFQQDGNSVSAQIPQLLSLGTVVVEMDGR